MKLTGPKKTRKQKNPGISDVNVSGTHKKNLKICSALVINIMVTGKVGKTFC
jgi:hypothetical protein